MINNALFGYVVILILVVLFVAPPIYVVFNFIYFMINRARLTGAKFFRIIEVWTIIILPILFMLFDVGKDNNCCSDSALFSPGHRVGIYLLIVACMFSYMVSIFRKQILAPILELLLNVFLILGIIINVLLCVHLNTGAEPVLWMVGNVPILMLLLMELSKNHLLLKTYIDENEIEVDGFFGKFSWAVLNLNPIMKYPVLLLMLVPILILLSLFLMLFGQKPDSLIRAFTDTYKHGFSQLDYMCDNVQCGGHFLCSVGANGHQSIVKPIRYGERNGRKIICNRQLLISNAFENLLEEKFPAFHLFIRNRYNRVGRFVHKYYGLFKIKIISDVVYIIMKPLEWLFLLCLYTFDKKPENRIGKQYLSETDRRAIDTKSNVIG